MNKENLERGSDIDSILQSITYNLKSLRDTEHNPSASDLMWFVSHITPKASEEIRQIAIKSLVNKRRSLQREFNKL